MTNSTVLSRFTFLSNSKVYKFTSLIWFHSLISFHSPTYSKVQQSKWSYLVYIFISLNSRTYSSVSQIQYYFLISHYITFNSPTYSTVSQIQLYYLLSLSYLIQWSYLVLHFHLFKPGVLTWGSRPPRGSQRISRGVAKRIMLLLKSIRILMER